MANLKELADEMAKLKKQFETVLSVSDYYNCEDLSGLDDYMQINTAEQWQQLEEFRHILNQIDEIESTLAYLERPIQEVSRIYINGTGRYETGKGHYYVSGSGIEFLRNEKTVDMDLQQGGEPGWQILYCGSSGCGNVRFDCPGKGIAGCKIP